MAIDASGAPRPLKICFVAPNLYPVLAGARDIAVIGGAEFRQAMLARALVNAGYEVSAVTQDFGQSDDTVIDGVRVLKTHTPHAGLPVVRYVHPRLTGVLRGLTAARADVYFQSSASHLTAVVACHARRAGARSIYSGASDTDFTPGAERMRYARDRWLFRWGLAHVDVIVAQTARQAALTRRHYRREAVVIPGSYAAPVRQRPPSRDLVLWVGGMRAIKRPERFIALARALPQYRFRMIGGVVGDDHAAREYFNNIRAAAAGIANLAFLGFRPLAEVEAHFDEARIFVNTSEQEGFPNTFLQAWARGIPTVSFFDSGAAPDGTRPFALVADEPSATAALRELLSDEHAWQALSRRALTYFAEHHATQKVVAQYAALLSRSTAKAA